MTLPAPGFSAVPTNGTQPKGLTESADTKWVRRIADAVNLLLRGKMNAVLSVTLAANAATTTVLDARITVKSALVLEPLTAHAASALYESPYILPSSQNNGSVLLNHVNDANTDKTFNLLIIG